MNEDLRPDLHTMSGSNPRLLVTQQAHTVHEAVMYSLGPWVREAFSWNLATRTDNGHDDLARRDVSGSIPSRNINVPGKHLWFLMTIA